MSKPIHSWTAAISKKLIADQEAAFMRAIGNTSTSTNVTASTPFDYKKLQEIALKVRRDFGPVDRFMSSRLFPADKALQVENEKHRFLCAHPHFWQNLADRLRADTLPQNAMQPVNSFYGMRIEQIDLSGEEDEGQRRYVKAIWADIKAAFEVAMIPLPDWLASPEKPR